MTVNRVWPFDQTLNPILPVGSTWNLVEIGYEVSEELINNIMILCTYTAQEQGMITFAE